MSIKSFFQQAVLAKTEFHLPKGTVVCGPLQADGGGLADGRLKGEINVGGKLVIGKNAEIKGDITAKMLEVHGQVDGNIYCADKVFINNTASIKGNITASVFEIKEGARIDGLIIKKDEPAPANVIQKMPETVVENGMHTSAEAAVQETKLPAAVAEQPPVVEPEPVAEKTTSLDKEASSWF